MLERVASVTPDAPIADYVVGNLAEHVRWLAEHDRVFTAEDDWRDAIVVGESAKWFDAWGMDWTIQGGPTIDEASIQHVSGPFAYGTHRVMRGASEVYAVPDDIVVWPLDEGIVKRVARSDAFDRFGKVEPVEIVASLGETSVLLRGHWTQETEHVARLFACAREASRTTATTPTDS
jgi:hypothetical protein